MRLSPLTQYSTILGADDQVHDPAIDLPTDEIAIAIQPRIDRITAS